MKHSPLPWRYDERTYDIFDANNEYVVFDNSDNSDGLAASKKLYGEEWVEMIHNNERFIVECVNACAGLTEEEIKEIISVGKKERVSFLLGELWSDKYPEWMKDYLRKQKEENNEP
jgi:hypothetical protein